VALGLASTPPSKTTFGDARQSKFAKTRATKRSTRVRRRFNDFLRALDLTTKEFTTRSPKWLTPDGVYMINIIDVYESDEQAEQNGQDRQRPEIEDPGRCPNARRAAWAVSRLVGGDGEAHVPHIYIFGTGRDSRPRAPRERLWWWLPRCPWTLNLWRREGDPEFSKTASCSSPSRSAERHGPGESAVASIILTDDYAPVETCSPRWPRRGGIDRLDGPRMISWARSLFARLVRGLGASMKTPRKRRFGWILGVILGIGGGASIWH